MAFYLVFLDAAAHRAHVKCQITKKCRFKKRLFVHSFTYQFTVYVTFSAVFWSVFRCEPSRGGMPDEVCTMALSRKHNRKYSIDGMPDRCHSHVWTKKAKTIVKAGRYRCLGARLFHVCVHAVARQPAKTPGSHWFPPTIVQQTTHQKWQIDVSFGRIKQSGMDLLISFSCMLIDAFKGQASTN